MFIKILEIFLPTLLLGHCSLKSEKVAHLHGYWDLHGLISEKVSCPSMYTVIGPTANLSQKAHNTVVGIICPPGGDRVNCNPKYRQGSPWRP